MPTSQFIKERYKRPESVLVVVYTSDGRVLLLKRADHPDFWQSVTGAMSWEEQDPQVTAMRELQEETGLDVPLSALRDLELLQRYPILPEWRYRYAPGVVENAEHAFAVELPGEVTLALHPEHTAYAWFDFASAAARATSWSDRAAIERIAHLRGDG